MLPVAATADAGDGAHRDDTVRRGLHDMEQASFSEVFFDRRDLNFDVFAGANVGDENYERFVSADASAADGKPIDVQFYF